jgi:hypothetical protein
MSFRSQPQGGQPAQPFTFPSKIEDLKGSLDTQSARLLQKMTVGKPASNLASPRPVILEYRRDFSQT